MIIDCIRYKKGEYKVLFCLLFYLVIFENFRLAQNVSLADVIYPFFAIYFFLKSPFSKDNKNSSYILLIALGFGVIAFLDFLFFNSMNMLLSQFRFIYNCTIFVVIARYFLQNENYEVPQLIDSYIYICVLCSMFIILQFLSFYLFHLNLAFDFGAYQGAINHASLEIPSFGSLYRTGGFFKEPSWFAVFMGPSLEIAYQRKYNKQLIICILGLIFSTSSMGFLFIFAFAFINLKNQRKYLFTFLLSICIIYIIFPMAFSRLFDALTFDSHADNSNNARVISPFLLFAHIKQIPVLGMDINLLYLQDKNLFLNTFLFVFASFGIIGLILFLKILLQPSRLLSIILLFTIIIEGCYGRMDFWMPLLVSVVYSSSPNYLKLRNF